MPLTERQQQLTDETVRALQQHAKRIKREVQITPERMEAFQNAARLKMTCTIDGVPVLLVEDEDAPEELETAIAAACKEAAETTDCEKCGGKTVELDDGVRICKKCRMIQPKMVPIEHKKALEAADARALAEERAKSRELLANARNGLTKHRGKS